MKLLLPSLALTALIFSSCSTAYKTGQTPDDVYFSPARPAQEYVVVDKEDDRAYRGSDYYEDRYLRNRIRNRYRYSVLDDYYNNPYAYNSYGYYSSWNSPWDNYWSWNSCYNPYYYGGAIIIKNPGNYRPPSRAVVFNPTSYSNNNTRMLSAQSYHPGSTYSPTNRNSTRYNNTNTRSNNTLGNSVRRVFSNSGSSDNNSSRSDNSTPTRSYNPSSSSSSSSSSGGRSSSSSSSSGSSRPIR